MGAPGPSAALGLWVGQLASAPGAHPPTRGFRCGRGAGVSGVGGQLGFQLWVPSPVNWVSAGAAYPAFTVKGLRGEGRQRPRLQQTLHPGQGFSRPGPCTGPRDLIVLKHSSYRQIFQCPLSLVSSLHICWNTVGCSLCSSDQLGVSLVLRGSGFCSHLSHCHLPKSIVWFLTITSGIWVIYSTSLSLLFKNEENNKPCLIEFL